MHSHHVRPLATATALCLCAVVAACQYTKTTETWDPKTGNKVEVVTQRIKVDPQALVDAPWGLVRLGKTYVEDLDKVVVEYDQNDDGKPDFVSCGGKLYRVTEIKRVGNLTQGRWVTSRVLIREPGKHPTPRVTMPLPAETYVRRFDYQKTLKPGSHVLTDSSITVHEALLNSGNILESYVLLSRRRLMLWQTPSIIPCTGIRERITAAFPTGFPAAGSTSNIPLALDDAAATICYTQELEGTFIDLARYLVRGGTQSFEMTVYGQRIEFSSKDGKTVTFVYNGRNLGSFAV